MSDLEYSEEQKQYLQGFGAGSGMTSLRLPVVSGGEPAPSGLDGLHRAAQDRFIAAGKKLTAEEQAKRNKNALGLWDEVVEHARSARFPKGADVFLFKFQGLFYVAPAQDAFMCRLRFPAGIISSTQLRGVADLAEKFGGGHADVTMPAGGRGDGLPRRDAVLVGRPDLRRVRARHCRPAQRPERAVARSAAQEGPAAVAVPRAGQVVRPQV